MVLFSQKSMFAFNVAMLILGPLVLIFLHHIPTSEPSGPSNEQSQQPPTLKQRLLDSFLRKPSFKISLRPRGDFWSRNWRWMKFWAIFIFGIIFQVILVATILSANRYVSYLL
jgi:hypothetical protein